jgi:predicted enzyme related to lactoylglutathione lyase
MAKITGLGGVFIKFNDPKAMNLWYKEVLEMNVNDYGVLFAFNDNSDQKGFMQLGTFEANSTYFGNEKQQVMLNFRVSEIENFIDNLKSKTVKILDELETYEYGKFIHIEDPEGNRIELWEPVDEVFEKTETFQEMS